MSEKNWYSLGDAETLIDRARGRITPEWLAEQLNLAFDKGKQMAAVRPWRRDIDAMPNDGTIIIVKIYPSEHPDAQHCSDLVTARWYGREGKAVFGAHRIHANEIIAWKELEQN
jgi:hypothetical protein